MGITDDYPTRQDASEYIIERSEPTVYGDADQGGYLSRDQLNFFGENGYLILSGLFEKEVQAILQEMPDLQHKLSGRDELILEPETQELRSIFSPERHSKSCYELAIKPPLLQSARQILDDDVYIHHSRINVKSGFDGKSFSWHSDFETWHAEDGIPRMRIITGWVFLTENNPFNGSLLVMPGSHKHFISCTGRTPKDNYKQSLRKQVLGVPSKKMMQQMADLCGIQALYGPPGTVVFHEGNLLHGSPDNMSPFARSNLFFVFNSSQNQPDTGLLKGQKSRPEFLARQSAKILQEDVSFESYLKED